MKKVLLIVLLLAVIGGIYYFFKIRSAPQQIPAGAVDLKFPLKDGPFEAIQSGPNGDTHNLPVEKYALDIARPTTISDWLKFRKSNLESNTTFDTPVYGPCTGPVTIAVDGFPSNRPNRGGF